MSGIKLKEEVKEKFEELSRDNDTIKAKFATFSQAIHEEQKALAMRAKELWAQTINDMNLEGEWEYKEGRIYPVDPPKVS